MNNFGESYFRPTYCCIFLELSFAAPGRQLNLLLRFGWSWQRPPGKPDRPPQSNFQKSRTDNRQPDVIDINPKWSEPNKLMGCRQLSYCMRIRLFFPSKINQSPYYGDVAVGPSFGHVAVSLRFFTTTWIPTNQKAPSDAAPNNRDK